MRTVHMNNVVILAGGRGSRMGEHTDIIPKPMVEIGGIPIIHHIMNLWECSLHDCNFYVLSGYKSEYIEKYFYGIGNVKVIYTGLDSSTGDRLLHLRDMKDDFFMCYGDGLTDFDFSSLKLTKNQVANMLVVHPIGRFGEIHFNNWTKRVTSFNEKPVDDRWINSGFMKFSYRIFDYIDNGDEISEDTFPRICADKKLYCTPYSGYWHCMDTPRDWTELNKQYKEGNAIWLK